MIRRGHLRVAFFACVLAGATAPAVPAWSFDLLGLIGLGGDKPPAPSADSITFTLEVDPGGVSALKQPLQDASSLYRLRNESVPTAESLVRIAESDLPKLVDAMWGAGYYEASAVVEVAGQRLALGREPTAAAIRLADGFRNRGPVPVKITAHPGPLFGMRGASSRRSNCRPGWSGSSPAIPPPPVPCSPPRSASSTTSVPTPIPSPR
jgi:translocation and assembly module TamA